MKIKTRSRRALSRLVRFQVEIKSCAQTSLAPVQAGTLLVVGTVSKSKYGCTYQALDVSSFFGSQNNNRLATTAGKALGRAACARIGVRRRTRCLLV